MTPEQRKILELTSANQTYRAGPGVNPIAIIAQVVLDLAKQLPVYRVVKRDYDDPVPAEPEPEWPLDRDGGSDDNPDHRSPDPRVRAELEEAIAYIGAPGLETSRRVLDRILDRLIESAPEAGYGWLAEYLGCVRRGEI